MGIEAKFGNGKIKASVLAFQKKIERASIEALLQLGEGLVAYARDNRNYMDRSGNLNNSVGYVIVKRGKIISSGGFQNNPASDSAFENNIDASKVGLDFAEQIAKETPNLFSLIIVAGMNYAACVEAKGYNVILPAELKAKADFPAAMKKLADKAKLKASELYGNF